MKQVKIKDIAEALNVSISTVSNTFQGKGGVSSEVRERILKTAKEMGYDLARYEKAGPGSRIGAVTSDKYLEVGVSFYWAMYQEVACAVSKKQGVTLFEAFEEDDEKRGTLPRIVQSGAVDGLVVIGLAKKGYIESLIANSGVPVVLLDFKMNGVACDAVVSGNYFGMYKITRYLIEHGHRDIAFAGSIHAHENIMDRYFGYKKGLLESGIEPREEWRLDDRDDNTWELGIELPEKLPTAFACNSDLTASRVYDALLKKGYHVPEDISIAGYDNYLVGHNFLEKLTTYNVDMKKMAEIAVKLLMRRIRGEDGPYEIRYIDSEIIERCSVRTLDQK